MKRIIGSLLCLVMLLTITSSIAFAAEKDEASIASKEIVNFTKKDGFELVKFKNDSENYRVTMSLDDVVIKPGQKVALAYGFQNRLNRASVKGDALVLKCIEGENGENKYQVGYGFIKSGHISNTFNQMGEVLEELPKKLTVNVVNQYGYFFVDGKYFGRHVGNQVGEMSSKYNYQRTSVGLGNKGATISKVTIDIDKNTIVKDNFMAVQGYNGNNKRCVCYMLDNGIWKQAFRTNGAGESGELTDLIVVDGNAYMVVKHYTGNYKVVADGEGETSTKNSMKWNVLGICIPKGNEYNAKKAKYWLNVVLTCRQKVKDAGTINFFNKTVGNYMAIQAIDDEGTDPEYWMLLEYTKDKHGNMGWKKISEVKGYSNQGDIIDFMVVDETPCVIIKFSKGLKAITFIDNKRRGFMLNELDENNYSSKDAKKVIEAKIKDLKK